MADIDSRAGRRYATQEILTYLEDLHHPLQGSMRRSFDSPKEHGLPQIHLAAAEAQTIALLLRLANAKKVVEIGTLAGFSALMLAQGVSQDGHIWTIEVDPKHARIARDNIESAGEGDRITVVEGDAKQLLPTLAKHGLFCAVVLDADKGSYGHYAEWATDHLRQGGLLIGDNAFYFGKLLDRDNESAAAMRAFHAHLAMHYDSVCTPTPDGLAFGIRR